jgi:hypothetical protein
MGKRSRRKGNAKRRSVQLPAAAANTPGTADVVAASGRPSLARASPFSAGNLAAVGGLLAAVVSIGTLFVALRDQSALIALQTLQLSDQRDEALRLTKANVDLRVERESLSSRLDQGRTEVSQLTKSTMELERQQLLAHYALEVARHRAVEFTIRNAELEKELGEKEKQHVALTTSVTELAEQRDELIGLGLRAQSVDEFQDGVVSLLEANYLAAWKEYYLGVRSAHEAFEQSDRWSDRHSPQCMVEYEFFVSAVSEAGDSLREPINQLNAKYPWLAARMEADRRELESRFPEHRGVPSGVLMP